MTLTPTISSFTSTSLTDLQATEDDIERGLVAIRQAYYGVGDRLKWIRDGKRWQAHTWADGKPRYKNFEDYCWARFKVSVSYASRLINASEIYAGLPDGFKPANEAQARELARVDADSRLPVLQQAAELASGGKITADLIKTVIKLGSAIVEESVSTNGSVSIEGQSVPIQAALTESLLEEFNRHLDSVTEHTQMKARKLLTSIDTPFDTALANVERMLLALANRLEWVQGKTLHLRAYVDKDEDET